MPGVKIDSDGRITVNGRFVEKLLLDGKDFFDGDKLVLLQNLPAYTVKDIQVYEKPPEWPRCSGGWPPAATNINM